MKYTDSIFKRWAFLAVLFTASFVERVYYDLGPNFELVTAASILSTFYIGKNTGMMLTFMVLLLTDIILGNSSIFLFTWTGFLIPLFFVRKFGRSSLSRIVNGTFAGTFSTTFFYIWTNFGVWLTSGMYEKTALGLIASYINALPFLKNQATSTLIFTGLGFMLTEIGLSINKKINQVKVENIKLGRVSG